MAVYYILSAKHVSSVSPGSLGNRQYSIIRETNEIVKKVTNSFSSVSEGCSPWHFHMLSRIKNLSLRCQSTLLYHLYHIRSQVTMPTKVYELQRQQLKTLHSLMWSHRIWQDAAKRADISTTDLAFISG
ncbi:hypothetical protein KIN20_025890, partial [Parelaphostrongylus tenuis]